MEVIEEPRLVRRAETPFVGIRLVTPFRGMLSKRDDLVKELDEWLRANDLADAGPFFFRLHVVDMDGNMDMEVGVVTPHAVAGEDRVRAGVLPSGDYATMTYRDHARRANKALMEWARDQKLSLDRFHDDDGDHFGCRYEAYLTDPRTEPRKTKWEVELNIRVA